MSLYNFKELIEKWKSTTGTANQLFQQKQHYHAVSFYEESLFYSELLFRHAQEADALGIYVVSPFSVSCINIAKNFNACNNVEKADAYYMYNVWQLKMLSKKEGITKKLYEESFHNWEKAVTELSAFHREINQPETVNFRDDETYEKIQNAKVLLFLQEPQLN